MIIIPDEPNNDESQITDRTRTKKRRVDTPSSSTSAYVAQPDYLDRVIPLPCCTDAEKETLETDVFTMVIDHTAELPNRFKTMPNMINAK